MGMNETCFDHLNGESTATISTDDRSVKLKLAKLYQSYPDDVQLVAENDDGSVMYHLPWKWVKFSPPRKVYMTDERKAELAERLRMMRSKD